MLVASQNSSFDTSGTSSNMDSYQNTDLLKVKNHVKDLLKSRIFLGRYLERRLISQLTSYRDIIHLSAAEIELKRDLLEVQTKLQKYYTNYWIGITNAEILGNPNGVCIWTEIESLPFGAFWFQIKSVKFRENEVILVLKCIRHISDAFLELEPILVDGTKKRVESVERKPEASSAAVLSNESFNTVIFDLKNGLSINNMKELVTFLFALIIAIITGSTTFINFLGNYILALVRELSILIKNSTPMFLGILDFFGKIIGGFYILLAMFFKPNIPMRVDKRSIRYNNRPQYNQYDDRNFD